ncbi:MAG: hypothetical protein HY800_00650 [Ignavibacteriales bacterium]|nr:hypothetical protein [Ignavibacteriales bacterium]
MNKKIFFLTTVAIISVIYLAGCELTELPLILDSSVSSNMVRVDIVPPAQYDDSVSINISALKDVTEESVDSLKFYNLTLMVENNTSPNNATVSGALSVNGYQLITLTNVSLSEFANERSIFDKNISGYQYHAAGVSFLLQTLKTQSPSIITCRASFGPVSNELHFDLRVKVYGQVFTSTD